MPTWYDFLTVDVFTTTPYEGNPLAIVLLPKNTSITQDQKDKVAKEFNLSETVFLHEDDGSENGRRFDIFTILGEIPWAGHPTIGTICYVGSMESHSSALESFLLKAKAGPVKAQYDKRTSFGTAEIPVNFHIHARGIPSSDLLDTQPTLRNALKDTPSSYPIASIVNGMNFVLVEMASLEELSHVGLATASISFGLNYLDDGWRQDLLGAYFYHITSNEDGLTKVRTRMIESEIGEDPATGSAASDLACFLTSKIAKANLVQTYEILQGVEMGRRSLIKVRVELNDLAEVKRVTLSGQAVKVQDGRILI